MEVTQKDLNGLGDRVQTNADNYLAFSTGANKDIVNMKDDIKENKQEIGKVYIILDGLKSMTYKIIGGVAAIVLISQVIGGFILFKVTQ